MSVVTSDFIRESIELKSSTLWREDNIVQVLIKDDYLLERQDVIEINNAIGKLSDGKKLPVLVEAGADSSADHGAREFSASIEGNQFTSAEAFVIKSPAQKLIVNFYLKFHRPIIPSKFFTRKEDALNWLSRYKSL